MKHTGPQVLKKNLVFQTMISQNQGSEKTTDHQRGMNNNYFYTGRLILMISQFIGTSITIKQKSRLQRLMFKICHFYKNNFH